MSFLNLNITTFTTLPKSCQNSIRRTGHCTCLSCSGAAPASSSSSRNCSKESRIWSIFSHNNNSNSDTRNSSYSSLSAAESGCGGNVGGEHDVSEGHMLTIVSEINKISLEREVADARCATFFESVDCCERGCKRTLVSFEEEREGEEEEDELDVLRDVEHMVRVIVERKKLVPVSRMREQENTAEDERVEGRWEKLRRRLRLMGSSGKRKCLRKFHKYLIEELI